MNPRELTVGLRPPDFLPAVLRLWGFAVHAAGIAGVRCTPVAVFTWYATSAVPVVPPSLLAAAPGARWPRWRRGADRSSLVATGQPRCTGAWNSRRRLRHYRLTEVQLPIVGTATDCLTDFALIALTTTSLDAATKQDQIIQGNSLAVCVR